MKYCVVRWIEEAESKVLWVCFLMLRNHVSWGKNSNYGVPYCIHFYLVLIWYIVKWHSPQIIICRKQSFSNPIPMDINVQCLLP